MGSDKDLSSAIGVVTNWFNNMFQGFVATVLVVPNMILALFTGNTIGGCGGSDE